MKHLTAILIATVCFLFETQAQLIQSGQAINITIANVPAEDKATINNTYPVSQNGMINMPHIGQVRAAGMLPEQLQSSLEARYKSAQIYRNPTIQVIASSADTLVKQVVYVGGDVGRKGPVEYVKGLTIYQALQAAGGATEFGTMRRVKLFRDGREQTYDLTQSQFRKIPVQPNDTIEVLRKNLIGR
jgi:protein involved in polysaccharide export with SLBB domain